MNENLKLPARLDGPAAEQLARDLGGKRGAAVDLDATDVVFAGALSMQVLVAAKKQWLADGQSLRLVGRSEGFDEGLRLLGVAPTDVGAAEEEEGVDLGRAERTEIADLGTPTQEPSPDQGPAFAELEAPAELSAGTEETQ